MASLRFHLRLACLLLRAGIQTQLEHRASFWMLVVAQFGGTIVEFVAIWALFVRFGALRSWSLPELAILYGTVNTGFALTDGLARGFDLFAAQVKSGDFDRVLLRPLSTAFQVAAQEVHLAKIGRLAQGLVVLLWGLVAAGNVDGPGLLVIAGSVLGGAAMFYGLLVCQATSAFWTVESLEVWNTVTYGGVEAAQYPMEIYPGWFRRFFTGVIPLACVSSFPLSWALGHREAVPGWYALLPWSGFLFLGISLRIWEVGVRRYASAGG